MKKLDPGCARNLFKEYLRASGYKETTIATKLCSLDLFFAYLHTIEKHTDLRDMGKRELGGFLGFLEEYVSRRTGKPLAKNTKTGVFGAVRLLFSCLYREERMLTNPLRDIRYKAKGEEKRKAMLSREEMNGFLDGITEDRPLGLRDRALFELMYSSGLRVGEAAGLTMGDIDFEERMLLIRGAKWGKDRVVPVSRVALDFLKRYVRGRRGDKKAPVFWGERGPIGKGMINGRFKKLLKACGLYRKGISAHSIRHAVATHLLANGADLRYVQELLAHESIETTCRYTHDLVENIKRVYKSFHPRENGYYKDIDEEYLKRLRTFEARLRDERRLANRERHRKRRQKSRLDKEG